MARAAKGWSVRDLAREARVSAATVNRFEVEKATPNNSTLAAIQRALEDAGIRFTERGVELVEGPRMAS